MVLLIRSLNVCGIKNSVRLKLSIREVSWQILREFNLVLVLVHVSLYLAHYFPQVQIKFQIRTYLFCGVHITNVTMPLVSHYFYWLTKHTQVQPAHVGIQSATNHTLGRLLYLIIVCTSFK